MKCLWYTCNTRISFRKQWQFGLIWKPTALPQPLSCQALHLVPHQPNSWEKKIQGRSAVRSSIWESPRLDSEYPRNIRMCEGSNMLKHCISKFSKSLQSDPEIRSWHNSTWQVFHPIHCPRLPVAGLVTLKVFGGTMMRPRAAMVPRKHEHRRPPLMSMILYDFHISKWRFCIRLDQACWLHWDVQSPNFLGICRMPRPRVQRPRHHRWAAGPFCSKAHSP